MYQVPHNPQNHRRWPILLICFYYAMMGFLAALSSCSFFTVIIGTNMLGGNQTLSLFWSAFLLLANVSRLGLFVGILGFCVWAYRGVLVVEALTIINLATRFVLSDGRITLIELAAGIIAMLIIWYLFQPNTKYQFLRSKKS